MNKKKVIIKGAYGDANIGDDLLLDMVLSFLFIQGIKPQNVMITCNNKSHYIKKHFKHIKVISTTSAKFTSCDYYILGGGTQFFAFKNDINVVKNRITIYFNIIIKDPSLILSIIKSKLVKQKHANKIALGIGLGPFYNTKMQEVVKNQLATFNKIYCRDFKSLDYCNRWGINAILSADLCLSDLFKKKYFKNHELSKSETKTIGVVLRDWTQNNDGNIINEKMFQFIENYKKHKIKIFIFSNSKDAELITLITDRGIVDPDDLHIWNPCESNFKNYLDIFNLCDLIITSRYHAAIFAVNYNIPTICLAIDPKLKYLVDEVKGFRYCPIDEIESIPIHIDNIIRNYFMIQKSISASYIILNKRANIIQDMFNHINIHL